MSKTLLLILIFFNFNAIAKKSNTKLIKIDMEIEYIDSKGNQLDRDTLTTDLVIRFPYIAGSIFGRTEKTALFLAKPNNNFKIQLNLLSAKKMVKKYARKLDKKWKEFGLKLKPKSTKILRVGTFPYDSKTKKLIGNAGFKDKKSGNLLMLVYVSKKSHLYGDVILGGEKYSHDVSFPSKGFYWLLSNETSKNNFTITRASALGEILFSIINNDIEFI